MKTLIFGSFIFGFALFGPNLALFGQDNAGVLVTGNFNQSFKLYGLKTDLTAGRGITPGAELIVKPRSRVSLGIGFKKLEFNENRFTVVSVADKFNYISNGKTVTVNMPGTVFASYNSTQTGSANAVLGTVYFNFTKNKPVQPFVGVGGGVGFLKEKFSTSYFVHPLFFEKTGFTYNLGGNRTLSYTVPVVTGKVGVNIYPAKHVIIRVAGGYLNGGFAEFGAGLVF